MNYESRLWDKRNDNAVELQYPDSSSFLHHWEEGTAHRLPSAVPCPGQMPSESIIDECFTCRSLLFSINMSWVPSLLLSCDVCPLKGFTSLGSSRKLQVMRHHYISLSLLGNIVIQRFLEGHYIARFFEDEIMQNKPFGKGFFFQI